MANGEWRTIAAPKFTMSPEPPVAKLSPNGLTRRQASHAVLASYLGWTMDAFDFFVIVFVVDRLAHDFNVAKSLIILTFTATLAMRPLGAFIFGILADRYGRRRPLMANVIFFSVI